jgi:putative membrane protein
MNTARCLVAAAALAFAVPSSAAGAGARVFTDAEILGIVGAANQGELQAAALASGRTTNGSVKSFAERMTKDHGDAKAKLTETGMRAGLTPADTDLSNRLTKESSDESRRLGLLNGSAFDAAYVDAQIADHSALLTDIDEDLIPSAKDPSVAALLRRLRPSVAHHLAMARSLEAELKRTK